MCPKNLKNRVQYVKLKVEKVKVVLDFRSDQSQSRVNQFSPFTCGKWNMIIKILAIFVKLLVAAQILIEMKKTSPFLLFQLLILPTLLSVGILGDFEYI